MGLSEASFAPATWDAVNVDGKQYAVPFDTHPIVLYYNKDKLAAAGLIGDDGLPKGLERRRQLQRRAEEAQGRRHQVRPISNVTADGSFAVPHHLLAALPAGRRDRDRRRLARRATTSTSSPSGAGRSPTG